MPKQTSNDDRITVQHEDGTRAQYHGDHRAVAEFVSAVETGRAREAEAARRWPGDIRQQMMSLANRFPSMSGVPGTAPWQPDELIRWCNTGAPTGGSRWAARFLLSVWNRSVDWTTTEPALSCDGRFDLMHAWSVWDDDHRAAALEWLQYPFSP